MEARGNTDKLSYFISMIKEVLDFCDALGVDLRKYPITFDSWSGGQKLKQSLFDMGFKRILIYGKSNHVMTIDGETTKLSEHKKQVQLRMDKWGCDKPFYRNHATSRAFGSLVLLFFSDMGKIRTMMVFALPGRACEIFRIWSQHHGIEQFWQNTRVVLCMT